MNFVSTVLLLLSASLSAFVTAVVLARDYRKVQNIAFVGISFGIACWAVGIAGFLNTQNYSEALIWAKFYYFAPILIVFSSVIFAQNFLYRKTFKLWTNTVIVAVSAALSILLIADRTFITHAIIQTDYGKKVVLDNGHYLLYSIYLLALFIVAIITVFRKSEATRLKVERQQARIFLVGYVASCITGVFFNLMLPGFGDYSLITIGPVCSSIFLLAVGYAIVRHRLFDIRSFVLRAAAYTFTVALITMFYLAPAIWIVSRVVHVHITWGELGYLLIFSLILTLVYQYLRTKFDQLTRRIFFRNYYDPQDLFDNLNRILVSTLNLDRLTHQISELLADQLKSEFCLIGLKETARQPLRVVGTIKADIDPKDIVAVRRRTVEYHQRVIVTDNLEEPHLELKKLLMRYDIAVLVRLAPNVAKTEEGLGYVVLGSKKGGNPYTGQDVRVLDTIANELVIAIQNALHFEEIQNFNQTLQERVHKATRELRRTNDKLKALDETKDEFITMASHQLRTPLTSVKGYLSMVIEGDAGKLNANQKKLLTQSFISAQRMVYLIADLLNLSRLNTGKFVIEPSPINLADVAQDEVNQLAETAKSRNIELIYKRPAQFPKLMLDENKIHQVVMNFIDNAIYYTQSGGTIQVELHETPTAIEYLVKDNGIGVPRSEQHRLFTKFYRAENAKKARPDGTGLGLFMAKKVIAAQGGAIVFESKEGKGSTFGFRFSKAHLVSVAKTPAPTQAQAT